MSNSVYPAMEGVEWAFERTQEYDTKSQRESGGRDLGIAARTQARYGWKIGYGFLKDYANGNEWQTLSQFYDAMVGRWDSFLFSDPASPAASLWTFRDGMGTGTLRTTGNGAWTVAYLCDWNGDPVAYAGTPTITVYVNGVLKTVTTDYALDVTTGALRITFVAAPGNGLSVAWSGGYYRRCKFVNDTMSITKIANGIYAAKVELISQVLP